MNQFNILDRNLVIHQNTLLEASAGTGKTFSMENLFVRLLLEPDPNRNHQTCTIDRILAVTFTKAATKELKERIRKTIVKSLAIIKQAIKGKLLPNETPDYLQKIIEEGLESLELARKRLESALFCFDDAKVFTIHGFCNRMLKDFSFESDWGGTTSELEETTLQVMDVKRVIHDLFRTEIRHESYSTQQLNIALKKHKSDANKLVKAIHKILSKNLPIQAPPDWEELYVKFQEILELIKIDKNITSKHILEDFFLYAPNYKGISNKQNEVYPEVIEKITRFAEIFDKPDITPEDFDHLIAEGLLYVDLFIESQLKSKALPPNSTSLHLPFFRDLLKQKLHPIISLARSYPAILASMSSKAQHLLSKYVDEEELFSHQNLLLNMHKAMQNKEFVNCVRQHYDSIIIDEFQDTDPLQWEIFSRLFLDTEAKINLYLVGDPKQSIYSFRQADIYTYLEAANAIGNDHKACLNTNYRSQPGLIKGLNTLFDPHNVPNLIGLPKLKDSLIYQKVYPAPTSQPVDFNDNLGCVHFCVAYQAPEESKGKDLWDAKYNDETIFFPFLSNEILKLKTEAGIKFSQWAILIKDRYQGKRLADYLKSKNIPYMAQKEDNLADSIAVPALMQLLDAVCNPFDLSSIKIALGGPLIGWTYHDFDTLETPSIQEEILSKFHLLHYLLLECGFALFFHEFLATQWKHHMTVAEELLMREGGEELYQELSQISEILIEHQNTTGALPTQLITFLANIDALQINEDERLKLRRDKNQDAVQILTLHMSKGLEFDIVFPIGLASRVKTTEDLIPVTEKGQKLLVPVLDAEDPEYQAYFEEIDAEKMRQLYVAMTRAKYRLYVPIPHYSTKTYPKLGEKAPIENYLSLFCHEIPDCPYREKVSRFLSFLDKNDDKCLSYHIQEMHKDTEELNDPSYQPDLAEPPTLLATFPSQFAYSFTAITKKSAVIAQGKRKSSSLIDLPPHNFLEEERTPHTLPSSSETGNLLHKIMEELPVSSMQSAQSPEGLIPFIAPFVKKTSYEPWLVPISKIIYNAWKTEIRTPFDCFNLSQIHPQHTYREMEFLYPKSKYLLNEPLEGFINEGDYLKGVIDFAFMHNEKYYLIDWKSNWLGKEESDYTQEKLSEAIFHHHYDLQASIYTEAFKRYLKLVEKRPFKDCFGGVFYLFLRGLSVNSKNTDNSLGVYYFPPNK